jgi:septum formation protein
MSMNKPLLILASASPRRHELLTRLGIRFQVVPAEIPEHPHPNEAPQAYVCRIASEKALTVERQSESSLPILASDTEVVLEGEIFGKPADEEQARHMLEKLSGREHQVMTAVSLRVRGAHWQRLNITRVRFREISASEIAAYWATGEPHDKAGGYAIQGLGALFINHIAGSPSGVMGLPLQETGELLARIGIDPFTRFKGK